MVSCWCFSQYWKISIQKFQQKIFFSYLNSWRIWRPLWRWHEIERGTNGGHLLTSTEWFNFIQISLAKQNRSISIEHEPYKRATRLYWIGTEHITICFMCEIRSTNQWRELCSIDCKFFDFISIFIHIFSLLTLCTIFRLKMMDAIQMLDIEAEFRPWIYKRLNLKKDASV